MTLVRIDDIAGVPLFYDRYNNTSYGVSAVPMRPYIEVNFNASCTACVQDLTNLLSASGLTVTQIWSGGVGRSGSGR